MLDWAITQTPVNIALRAFTPWRSISRRCGIRRDGCAVCWSWPLTCPSSTGARERLALVNEASTRIGSTPDLTRTAEELVEVAVPGLADFATIDLLDSVFRSPAA